MKAKEYCGEDKECADLGTRWTTIFLMNAILLLIISVNMIFVAVGAFKPVFRCIGAWSACVICPAHLAIIIVSFIIRFSHSGRACSLSLEATNWPSADPLDSNDFWTFKKDAQLILGILIIQISCCCCCCLTGCAPISPSPN